jgi:hypothetical protein
MTTLEMLSEASENGKTYRRNSMSQMKYNSSLGFYNKNKEKIMLTEPIITFDDYLSSATSLLKINDWVKEVNYVSFAYAVDALMNGRDCRFGDVEVRMIKGAMHQRSKYGYEPLVISIEMIEADKWEVL